MAKQHRQRQPRLAVVGQFRMVVEAIARSLAPTAQVRTVVLENTLTTTSARDAVLRVKADAVVLVLATADTLDAHGMVTALAERGQRVVVTGDFGGRDAGAELVASGAAAFHAHGVSQVRRLVALVLHRRTPLRRVPHPAEDPVVPSDRRIRRNLGSLTATEARILWQLMHGKSVSDIAREHVVSIETVRSQIRTVLTKLDSTTQLAAVAQAWSVNWRPAPATLAAA